MLGLGNTLVNNKFGNSFTGILNKISVPTATAYSLRLLNKDYTGNAIRVRRSSDNAETNIGFVNGKLDTATLLTFCGVGSGFVTTWYDQSGNARNATEATAISQPRIVNAGVVDSLNGKPMVRASGTQKLAVPILTDLTTAAISVAYAQETTNNQTAPFQFNNLNLTDHLPYLDGIAYTGFFSTNRPSFGAFNAIANTPLVATVNQNGTTLSLFRNGLNVGSSGTLFKTPTTSRLFNGSALAGSACYLAEAVILSTSIETADRQLLEANQMQYYGIS